MVIYAAANACIGATPAAYAADVMPSAVSGFGLGIYRCAGDVGAIPYPGVAGDSCSGVLSCSTLHACVDIELTRTPM